MNLTALSILIDEDGHIMGGDTGKLRSMLNLPEEGDESVFLLLVGAWTITRLMEDETASQLLVRDAVANATGTKASRKDVANSLRRLFTMLATSVPDEVGADDEPDDDRGYL